ncbi:MAG: ChbG/HpnK family deacetylase [Planctomycetes bacterium]|nr:ChbG/HpnK family deacetylase [Planctomycetota bacterium]
MVIINADDFGLDARVNAAIVECFARGYCSSTTLMANMPGFEEACELVRCQGLSEHVGVHLVLTSGTPLTDRMRNCPRFCDTAGRFCLVRTGRLFLLASYEKEALFEELRAQVLRCREQGVTLTHADSHKHIHVEWAIASAAMRVCRAEGIPWLRLARNCRPRGTLLRAAYRHLLNWRIARAGLARTRYFGTPNDYRRLVARRGALPDAQHFEILMHPTLDDGGALVDSISGVRLADCLPPEEARGRAVSFAGKQYRAAT